MKTAMQELIEKLSMKSGDSFYSIAFYHDNDEIIKEALEKEKEQIIDAYNHNMTGFDKLEQEEIGLNWAEDYYNQTYNNNNK
jgi:hypothetical protein